MRATPKARENGICVIVSVYRNVAALKAILVALGQQSQQPDQVIISEDGEAPEIVNGLQQDQPWPFVLTHLHQPDSGFRKNRALNRACCAAQYDWLVFIDGDCVPHQHFIRAHASARAHNTIATGRRVELGPRLSAQSLENGTVLKRFRHLLGYLSAWPALLSDGVKNPESGLYSAWLDQRKRHKPSTILGCNFSCSFDTLAQINGFNEDYQAAGIGEDSNLQWRFEALGMHFVNLKFSAIQYHLYHPRAYQTSVKNQQILQQTREQGQIRCSNGLQQHCEG